ncbi:hypothetical protein J2Q21_12530 [Tenacibaculum finnmarkense genomovar ulcerans]|uniref:hypothetical protein n=1 Tax=Tenacibaculum finnmarkense TaxID=2781243 RepID=UPI001EFC10D6|nr:hypothetical protein [Tenacibaculum finnmarkense]MCG8237405.1 hypothetical protein [Tenacibaculum finnmarkense genomovar ulcerans]
MNDEQRKIATDIILFIKANGNKTAKSEVLNTFSIDPIDRAFILRTLIYEYELIKVYGELFSLSKKGFSFSSFNKLEEEENIVFEKSKIDLKLKKWQLKTFWPIFIFAIIGSGLGIYNFTNSLTPSEEIKQQEQRIEQMELELEKLQTSILNQKKSSSLRMTKGTNYNENK